MGTTGVWVVHGGRLVMTDIQAWQLYRPLKVRGTFVSHCCREEGQLCTERGDDRVSVILVQVPGQRCPGLCNIVVAVVGIHITRKYSVDVFSNGEGLCRSQYSHFKKGWHIVRKEE